MLIDGPRLLIRVSSQDTVTFAPSSNEAKSRSSLLPQDIENTRFPKVSPDKDDDDFQIGTFFNNIHDSSPFLFISLYQIHIF